MKKNPKERGELVVDSGGRTKSRSFCFLLLKQILSFSVLIY